MVSTEENDLAIAGELCIRTYNRGIMKLSRFTINTGRTSRWMFLASLLAAVLGCGGHASTTPIREAAQPATSGSSETQTTTTISIRIAAASDLKFAMDEIIREFRTQHQEIEVDATFGSSGNFYAQLCNKAPFDVFFSADSDYPRRLIEQGLAIQETSIQYAVGQIVVWVRNDSLLDIDTLGMQTLMDPSIKKIAIANPRHAPYGRAAEVAMKSLSVYDAVTDRLVVGENVSQAAQFVESGAADVGIIALSLATSSAMKDKGRFGIVPRDSYPTLIQTAVVLSSAGDQQACNAFCDFVIGVQGQEILARHGFLVPGE